MNPNPPPRKPDATPPSEHATRPVQSGALPGLQPGPDTGTPATSGQSNVDATLRQGTEYGDKKERRPR